MAADRISMATSVIGRCLLYISNIRCLSMFDGNLHYRFHHSLPRKSMNIM